MGSAQVHYSVQKMFWQSKRLIHLSRRRTATCLETRHIIYKTSLHLTNFGVTYTYVPEEHDVDWPSLETQAGYGPLHGSQLQYILS